MKKSLILVFLFILCFKSFSQLYISPGATIFQQGSGIITVQNTDFINDGNFTAGLGRVAFAGNTSSLIKGSSTTSFYEMEVTKNNGARVLVNDNINVINKIIFASGLMQLNGGNIDLGSTGFLENENENSRITTVNNEYIVSTQNLNAPVSVNAGNLGVIISSSADMGVVRIKRGHKPQSGTGISGSITRYYDIAPVNNNALNATVRFHYFDEELNSYQEEALDIYKSVNSGANWQPQLFTSRNKFLNYVEKTGVNDFSLWTLSGPSGGLPVTGLQFYAKRLNNKTVELNWKTIQEINNKGFYIERKKDNEAAYSSIDFVGTQAFNGNSGFPLQYSKKDANDFTGKTYYRLKQEDTDGHTTYSEISVVNGSNGKQTLLQVWPVPSAGPVNVLVNGLERTDILQVFDINGRMVQQHTVQNNNKIQLVKLMPGTYIIKLAGNKEMVQKLVVQ